MALYDNYDQILDKSTQQVVTQAISNIDQYCYDISKRLKTDFTITVEHNKILFFDIRHSNPHYYIEILRESGIVNVKGYGHPNITIIGGR